MEQDLQNHNRKEQLFQAQGTWPRKGAAMGNE